MVPLLHPSYLNQLLCPVQKKKLENKKKIKKTILIPSENTQPLLRPLVMLLLYSSYLNQLLWPVKLHVKMLDNNLSEWNWFMFEKKSFEIRAMFVSRNSLSGKPLSKLSCVCLSLRKLVNGKHFPVNGEHFPVNGEHFPVNEKHFPVKEKFGLVSRKVFSLWLCLFSGKWFPGNHFPNFPVFVCH